MASPYAIWEPHIIVRIPGCAVHHLIRFLPDFIAAILEQIADGKNMAKTAIFQTDNCNWNLCKTCQLIK
jgi:hypothetical protein